MWKKLIYLISCVLVLGLAGNVSGWTNQDIGSDPAIGSASYDGATGTWTVQADGWDIFGNSDSFHYVYKYLKGDGHITARVVSIGGPSANEWRKVGVMMREELTGESKNALMLMTPTAGHSWTWQWRNTTGGATSYATAGEMGLPYWVRIERSGDTLTGYTSPDGSSWTQQGSPVVIDMRGKGGAYAGCYIGLAVTSHESGILCEAKFDSVSLVGEISDEPPPQLQAWGPVPADGATGVIMPMLDWTPGDTAKFHNVYLGTNPTLGPDELIGPMWMLDMYWFGAPGPGLDPGATYYWRIDELEADATTIYTGDVWSFTAAPPTSWEPSPADGSKFIDPNVDLSWRPGFTAITHDVHFGTVDPPPLVKAKHPDTTYDPGPLAKDTSYYWRIDGVESGGTRQTGDVWSFTTMPDIAITDPTLMGWWKLDEGEGSRVLDWSGHSHHGTLMNGPTWAAGYDGGALEFDGMDDYVDISYATDPTAYTITAWVKPARTGPASIVVRTSPSGPTTHWSHQLRITGAGMFEHYSWDGTALSVIGITHIEADTWYFVAGPATNAGFMRLYVNGRQEGGATSVGTLWPDGDRFLIGSDSGHGMNWYAGLIDDVRVYDYALSYSEIQQVMRVDPLLAWSPKPPNGSKPDIEHVAPLSWSPGDKAAKHYVYFGIDKDAVEDADTSDTTGIYRGLRDPNTYTPSEAPEFGQIYHWRIDEYNTDATTSKGRVWSFTVADYLAVEDFESYDDFDNRIYLTWIDGYGSPSQGIPGNSTGSTVGHLAPPYAEQTIVHEGRQSMPMDYNNVNLPFYSEAERTFASPEDWTRKGVKALVLWFRGHPGSVGSFSYDPVTAVYTMTGDGVDIWDVPDFPGAGPGNYHDEFRYAYKRLSGVATIEAQVLSVDETDVWAKAGVMIRETLDANSPHAMVAVTPGNGVAFQYRGMPGDVSANVNQGGITAPHWLKLSRSGNTFTAQHSTDGSDWETLGLPQTVVMAPNVYVGLALTSHNNDPKIACKAEFSDVTITGAVTGQWESRDIGITSNAVEQLYVTVEDSTGKRRAVEHLDPNAVLADTWQEWNIDLKEFGNAGVDLTSVKKVYIGVGNREAPKTGGTGSLYIDDIRLYRARCVPSLLKPDADLSDNCMVDYSDLEIMAGEWLVDANDLQADLDLDNDVDFRDYAGLAETWLDQLLWPLP